LLAGQRVRVEMAPGKVIRIEEPRRPAVRIADLIAAGVGNGFVFDQELRAMERFCSNGINGR
jgi:hypothetical protein